MAATDRTRTVNDLPPELPVFPLQGCILLPRTTLPLNVFEPRYLAMINDVLAGNRLLGIIQPADVESEAESPAGKSVQLRGIGCAGRLTGFEELDDGRMRIVLTGICRFAILDERDVATPYRKFHVDYQRFALDLERGAGAQDVDRGTLLGMLKAYLEAKRLQVDWEAVEQSGVEQLVNGLSVVCPYRPEEKQALLEAMTLKERAEVLLALAKMELAAGHAGTTRGRLQ